MIFYIIKVSYFWNVYHVQKKTVYYNLLGRREYDPRMCEASEMRVIRAQWRGTRGMTGWNIRRQFRKKEYSCRHVPRPLKLCSHMKRCREVHVHVFQCFAFLNTTKNKMSEERTERIQGDTFWCAGRDVCLVTVMATCRSGSGLSDLGSVWGCC